jgi:hypothetical protein
MPAFILQPAIIKVKFLDALLRPVLFRDPFYTPFLPRSWGEEDLGVYSPYFILVLLRLNRLCQHPAIRGLSHAIADKFLLRNYNWRHTL